MENQTEKQTKAEKKSLCDDGFLRRSEVLYFLRESPTGLQRKIKLKFYPEGTTLPGGRTRVWRASDIRLLISLISDGKTWLDHNSCES